MAAEIKTLYSDKEKQNQIYPRTKVEAITNNDGTPLARLVSNTFKTCTLPKITQAGTVDVAVEGVTAESNPILSVYIENEADASAIRSDWSKIYRADTYEGGIKFYSNGATTAARTVLVKGY